MADEITTMDTQPEDTVVETPPADTQIPDTPTPDAPDADPAKDDGQNFDFAKIVKKQEKEISRLIGTIKNLQADKQQSKQDTKATAVEPPARQTRKSDEGFVEPDPGDIVPAHLADHPALNGKPMKLGDDGVWYVYDHQGRRYRDAEDVAERYDLKNGYQTLQERIEARDRDAEQAQLTQARQRDIDRLATIVSDSVSEMRAQAFPHLDEEAAEYADEYLAQQTDAILQVEMSKEGAVFSAAMLEKAGNAALAKAKRLFGGMGLQQLKSNQKVADTVKVKPGEAPPGTPAGKSMWSERR